MRAVLALSTLVLLMALLGHVLERGQDGAGDAVGDPGQAISVQVGSRGHMLPRAPMEGSASSFDDAMSIGDLLLTREERRPGLCVALMTPELKLGSYELYPVASETQAVGRLLEDVRSMPVGSLLVASVTGDVHPAAPDLERLDAWCAELGARVSPFRAQRASWALIAVRLEQRWATLCEGYSEERALSLSFTLKRRFQAYSKQTPEFFFARASGPQALSLYHSASSTSSSSPENRTWERLRVGSTQRSALQLKGTGKADAEPSAHMRWERIRLGDAPAFETHLALQGTGSVATRCGLLVNDELVDSLELPAAATQAWLPWRVDLSRWAGQEISLTLESTPLAATGRWTCTFGDAQLLWSTQP